MNKSLIRSTMEHLYKIGAVPVAANDDKSVYNWGQYQTDLSGYNLEAEIIKAEKSKMYAIICRDGFEVIDIDQKYCLDQTLNEKVTLALFNELGLEEYNKLQLIYTRSGGAHLFYRCKAATDSRNAALAKRKATPAELKDSPNKVRVLVETRGFGGYVIGPNSTGYSFADSDYKNDISQFKINEISLETRNKIWAACRSFDELGTVYKKIES